MIAFLLECISGSGGWFLFLVEVGAAIRLASSGSDFIPSKMALRHPRACTGLVAQRLYLSKTMSDGQSMLPPMASDIFQLQILSI
ncbi:hypothetical protein AYM39_16410 [Methylomonas sp. DH-1]|nr:hypothetical protein AYM39_16410 [Methylomonas sp. DH-1]